MKWNDSVDHRARSLSWPGGLHGQRGRPCPENCTGAVLRFAPDLVVLVDAAEMGEAPATIRWLDWQETTGLSASPPTLPPPVEGEGKIWVSGYPPV